MRCLAEPRIVREDRSLLNFLRCLLVSSAESPLKVQSLNSDPDVKYTVLLFLLDEYEKIDAPTLRERIYIFLTIASLFHILRICCMKIEYRTKGISPRYVYALSAIDAWVSFIWIAHVERTWQLCQDMDQAKRIPFAKQNATNNKLSILIGTAGDLTCQ